tara:strand:- start:478 stop:1425 length:948 start_codon:yes stop_codon:yes gene_type:complete
MIIASCPLRISLFGGSTDNPYFVEKHGYGSVISFTSNLKTYVTISQDKFGFNKKEHKYIINYSKREEVSSIREIKNEVVRTVLEYFDMPPIQVTLTSDAYSQGSGLASSSSYTISLIKACSIFLNKKYSDYQICELAHQLELKYNPYCGYQDPYGCGIGGFKRMEFYKDSRIKYEFLPNDLFNRYDMFLIYTGVTRNSKKILADITQNLDKVKPLLDIVEEAYSDVYTKNSINLLYHLKNAWDAKKKISSIINENPEIKKLDDDLSHNQKVLAHKLCGAGNGGFFLTFAQKNELTLPNNAVKIEVVTEGVLGESI